MGEGLSVDPRAADHRDLLEQEALIGEVQARLFGARRRSVRLQRYILLERIGAGGLGVVYAAYDPELERRVAIKLVKADGDLLDEARAMAKLSHPNVIEVYDVGTFDAGGVFIVMELVSGPRLDVWLQARSRSPDDVIETFVAAGRGLAAAHRAGLVHRDFKPANVLIADGGRPVVLDFGLARPVGDGTVLGGTPRYMAPEQARGRQVRAAADQYAFCTALFEALTGAPPFGRAKGVQLQAAKRIGTVGSSALPKWLEACLLRGLSPEPARRFPDMDALLAALQRNPSRRRRRWLLGSAAVLTIGATASLVAAAQEEHADCSSDPSDLSGVWDDARREAVVSAFASTDLSFAEASARRVVERLDRHAARWHERREEACLAFEVQRAHDAAVLRQREDCLERRRVEFQELVDVLTEADATVVARAVTAVDGLVPPGSCLGQRTSEEHEAVPSTLIQTYARAHALYEAGKPFDALRQLQLVTERPSAYPRFAASFDEFEGRLRTKTGNPEAGAHLLYTALERAQALGDDRTVARAAISLTAVVGFELDRVEEARRLGRLALATIERAGGDPLLEADAYTVLGAVARKLGDTRDAHDRFARAVELREATLGDDAMPVAVARNNLALALGDLGRHEAKRSLLEVALAAMERGVGLEHPDLATVLTNLGLVTAELGDDNGGIALLERGLAIRRAAYGDEHTAAAGSELELGRALVRRGDLKRARQLCGHARAVFEAADAPGHPRAAAAAACEAGAQPG